MIWSGSVLPDASDNYAGSGLEIHDGTTGSNESYFKFRTKPSVFDVKTKTFYLGGTSNFVSGSLGNIEISSSNFHLSNTGNVTTTGTLTATAGKIGDWVITGSNMESNTDYFRGIKFKPSDKIVGYGTTNHQNTSVVGSFSFGVAPTGGGGGHGELE